jgi:hypothetical protein
MTREHEQSKLNRDVTVQVYVRPGLLLEPLDAKIETLQRLETEGEIDAVTVQAWPDTVPLSDAAPYTEVVDLYERFTLWADRHDRSITPPFTVRTQSTVTSEGSRRVLSTPMMCLAVYSGRTLAVVYPHADGDDHYSVTDAIAALRTDGIERIAPRPEPEPSAADASSGSCPDCDGPLANVQGVRVCQDCAWNDYDRDESSDDRRRIDPVAH